ncbi:MAG: PAS domain-containing protein [Verrucomicrobiales bacterium]
MAVPKTFAREIEQLRAVNFHFSFALDHVAEAVAIVEADPLSGLGPQIVYANRAMRAATGYSESEIVRLPFGRVYDEFKLAELLRRLMAEMPAERPASFVGCLTAKSGERIPGDWSIRAVLDEEGTPVNYTVSFCPKPVPAATPEVAKPAAPAPAEALEPADEPAVPKPINGSAAPAAAAPSKKLAPLFAIASQNGTAAANGSLSPAEATAPKVAEPERKSLEEQERESNDQIFRRSRMESLAFMASGIAHDFNNVLTPIMGGISVLEDKLENGEPFEGEAVRAEITEMARAADKARLLAQKILHFAKGTTAPKKPTHLGRLLEDSICVSTRGGNVTCATDLCRRPLGVGGRCRRDHAGVQQPAHQRAAGDAERRPIRARAWNLRCRRGLAARRPPLRRALRRRR